MNEAEAIFFRPYVYRKYLSHYQRTSKIVNFTPSNLPVYIDRQAPDFYPLLLDIFHPRSLDFYCNLDSRRLFTEYLAIDLYRLYDYQECLQQTSQWLLACLPPVLLLASSS